MQRSGAVHSPLTHGEEQMGSQLYLFVSLVLKPSKQAQVSGDVHSPFMQEKEQTGLQW